ncbi:condensation domain-containing protein [Streptomyces sp. NPDC058964]|uniref:condensation domain-containing protein n=1 Tax=Streptomyces sp. NPDC058964 TaxID=3346681 RepID=UPI00368DD8A4
MRTPLEALLDLAADVMGHDPGALPAEAAGSPFITLGGSLEQAMRLQARADEQLRLSLDLALLLGPAPLAEVLALAVPVPAVPTEQRMGPWRRPALPEQRTALAPGRPARAAYRVLSAEVFGPLDPAALRTALDALGARHEGLRTVFTPSATGPVRRVLADCPVPLVTLERVVPGPGQDAVAAVHARLAADVEELAGRPGRPPLAFVLTPLGPGRRLLSFLHHEAVADAWSAALVWQELLADYGRTPARAPARTAAPGPDTVARRAETLRRSGALRALTAERAGQLRDVPAQVTPVGPGRHEVFDFRGERLPFGIDEELRDAVEATARRAGVPHSTVVLAAWALVLGRRAGVDRLLVGTEMPLRPTAALLRTVAPCTATLPLCCEVEPTTDYFLRGLACAFSEALAYAEVDAGWLTRELGLPEDPSRPAPARVTFAAHDELLPTSVRAGGLTVRFHHGHLGGATADAALTVLRWRERPLLALDFATSVLHRSEAVRLAAELRTTLRALAHSHPWTLVDDLLPPLAAGGARATALR